MNRILPDQQFLYKGTLTTSSTLLTPNQTQVAYIKELILTNVTANDVTVTITTGESSPTTEWPVVVSSYDQIVRTYDQGWDFTNGIKASAGSNDAIRAQIWGYQKSS